MPTNAASLRSAEIRELPAQNDAEILRPATATLQDLGYTITESAPGAGVLAGSKSRDAVESGQVAGQIVLTVVSALLGAYHPPVYDQTQQINVTMVVSPVTAPNYRSVRVSFDRYITNNQGQLWRTQLVEDPKIYQQFYDNLTKGLALQQGSKS